jgi:hypothetical protein
MPDIAKLDGDGMLIAVETVTADEHRTDPQAGTVALPDSHDMRQRLKGYRWDAVTASCRSPPNRSTPPSATRPIWSKHWCRRSSTWNRR